MASYQPGFFWFLASHRTQKDAYSSQPVSKIRLLIAFKIILATEIGKGSYLFSEILRNFVSFWSNLDDAFISDRLKGHSKGCPIRSIVVFSRESFSKNTSSRVLFESRGVEQVSSYTLKKVYIKATIITKSWIFFLTKRV